MKKLNRILFVIGLIGTIVLLGADAVEAIDISVFTAFIPLMVAAFLNVLVVALFVVGFILAVIFGIIFDHIRAIFGISRV